MTGSSVLWVGAAALALAAVVVVALLVVPSRAVPASRRRYSPDSAGSQSRLTKTTDRVVHAIDVVLRRRDGASGLGYALDTAGIRLRVPEFVLIVASLGVTGGAVGFLIGGLLLAALFAVAAVALVYLFVSFRADRRRQAFSDSLDDLVQLLATNLRAGHGMLQSLDALSRDIDQPASGELARVVNQVRVGMDLGVALDEVAARMDSDDFRWVAQAIAIQGQVGGNLADVLDTVSQTIRERNQVRRQARALSAEGRMSAWVLILLPVAMALLLSLMNPLYMRTFTSSLPGFVMIAAACALLLTGALWLRKLVKVRF